MKNNRRKFFKQIAGYGGLFVLSGEITLAQSQSSHQQNAIKQQTLSLNNTAFKPLDILTIKGAKKGFFWVKDGKGQEYVRELAADSFSFQVGGALGNHTIILLDENKKILDFANFEVNCQTEIKDKEAKFYELSNILHKTMIAGRKYAEVLRLDEKDKFYHYFVDWIRDHVHTLKGLKYFYPELKTGIELYRDYQRQDGMIWDNIRPRTPEKNIWDLRFAYDDFILPIENSTYEFKRIPVENDVEYLFIEGIYYTWKATGDNAWMASQLDAALKALNYSTSDPYRWSKKYQLLKRGFTIDTWDFQSDQDIVRYIGNSPDPMVIDKNKTRFGIMFGDNTGMATSCRYLAEMLEEVERKAEANRVRQLGKALMARLNKLAWNGNFYTHHIPEDSTVKRDFGIDQSEQISLSNAYSINRDLTHEQCVAIIKSYQKIRQQMPESSPGEWYTIYPPFAKGFSGDMWEYMNGGVTSIVAGELAHGAFEHGFEEYGVDILERIFKLARKHNNFLYCTHRGAMPTPPKRQFTPLNLKDIANVDFFGAERIPHSSQAGKNAIGWIGEGENDLHQMPVGQQIFQEIPFNIIDPQHNDRRACLGLSGAKGYLEKASLSVNSAAKSIYFLHTMSNGTLAGSVSLEYDDGNIHTEYMTSEKINNWWFPTISPTRGKMPLTKVAWRGANKVCPNVGVYVYGLNNPYPEKTIKSLQLEGVKNSTKWLILGITLSDAAVFFMPDEISTGIPHNWGAAAVFYALIEGLAGIKDTGVAFERALLAPRWLASGTNEVVATAKYEASGGYLSYKYQFEPQNQKLNLNFTGTAKETVVEILLPHSQKPQQILLNQKPVKFDIKNRESSTYACLTIQGLGVHTLEIDLVKT